MKTILPFLILTTVFFSCTKEVEIEIPGYQEQIVIDGQIETNQPPIVLISKTKDIYSPTDLNSFLNNFVTDATVTISDGVNSEELMLFCSSDLPPGMDTIAAALLGIPIEELANYNICAYTTFNTDFWGEVGKTYTLTVDHEGENYEATTSILPPVQLDSVWWAPEGSSTMYGWSWARLSDPAGQYDAYKWEVKRINTDSLGNEIDQSYLETYTPVFDDEFFDGLSFNFYYENPYAHGEGIPTDGEWLFQVGDTVVIKFSKIDKDVYNFLYRKAAQVQTSGNPFATPINIPSNFSNNALGVWAGYSPTYDTLICQ